MTATTTTATTPDYDEIVRVVQLYIDGFNDGDIARFKEAFHENAWIFFTDAEGGHTHHDLWEDRRDGERHRTRRSPHGSPSGCAGRSGARPPGL